MGKYRELSRWRKASVWAALIFVLVANVYFAWERCTLFGEPLVDVVSSMVSAYLWFFVIPWVGYEIRSMKICERKK